MAGKAIGLETPKSTSATETVAEEVEQIVISLYRTSTVYATDLHF